MVNNVNKNDNEWKMKMKIMNNEEIMNGNENK